MARYSQGKNEKSICSFLCSRCIPVVLLWAGSVNGANPYAYPHKHTDSNHNADQYTHTNNDPNRDTDDHPDSDRLRWSLEWANSARLSIEFYS